MEALKHWFKLCFTFEQRVTRADYIRAGLALALLKFAGDAAIVYFATGKFWAPTDYYSPLHILISTKLADAPAPLLPMLGVWALPFVWVGITMSMRRALDAGLSAFAALFFFVPVLSYFFIVFMCAVPTDPHAPYDAPPPRPYESRLPGALLSIAAGLGIGLGMIVVSAVVLKSYGPSLFIGTPFVIGTVTSFIFNKRYPATFRETMQVVSITVLSIGGMAVAIAAEGLICVVMAAPIGIALAAMGAAAGREVALYKHQLGRGGKVAMLALPLSALFDASRVVPDTNIREVRSSIEIAATPEQVWKQVIAFPALPKPNELVFRVGIAYPKHAEIRGEGVGAIRYCVFSTGAFIEPITRWEFARRLSFDVASSPPPLDEWSPFRNITPPHIDGYFNSKRGEFRLIALPNGRTRLEGSTWYAMKIYPEGYWGLYGDYLISRIHSRVLQHIKTNAELQ